MRKRRSRLHHTSLSPPPSQLLHSAGPPGSAVGSADETDHTALILGPSSAVEEREKDRESKGVH